ncbi:HAD family hydrolase [Mesorhizobium newzealandense]|uniref:HAD family hydrolase n=3 Tax=Mesorhizobium TaxID=68287 RepID=A0ABW4WEI7_9HYPH
MEPRDAVMVGDSAIDIDAAHNASLPVVFLLNGYMRSPNEAAEADLTIADLGDLAAAIEAIWAVGRPRFSKST